MKKSTKHSTTNPLREQSRDEHASSIDLGQLYELRSMSEFVQKFLGEKLPSPLECTNAFRSAYLKADALLEYCADADIGQAESGPRTEPVGGWVIDVIKLHLEMLCVANQRLDELLKRAEQAGPARADGGPAAQPPE